jgi:hypothetical protein
VLSHLRWHSLYPAALLPHSALDLLGNQPDGEKIRCAGTGILLLSGERLWPAQHSHLGLELIRMSEEGRGPHIPLRAEEDDKEVANLPE